MKATVALITINEAKTLNVLLVPEDQKELTFLREVADIEKLEFKFSWEDEIDSSH